MVRRVTFKSVFTHLSICSVFAAFCADAAPTWRVRKHLAAPLNADSGWAAEAGEMTKVASDHPFRLRMEWERQGESQSWKQGLILQYRRNGDDDWIEVNAFDYPYPEGEEPRSPRVSVVSTSAYTNGEPTTDLLPGSKTRFAGGSGLNLAAAAPTWTSEAGHMEMEWPIVIRRWIDGAETNNQGDRFEFRLASATGKPVEGSPIATVELTVTERHVGGTFVETPGRIGPWQASNGDLYFIMEPAESSNLFMMVKSSDEGQSWVEIDGENRPKTDDLESVDGLFNDGEIELIHQVTEAAYRHAFRTSDHPTDPDTWATTDELISQERSIAQAASLVLRKDGSMVAFYVGESLRYSIRTTEGEWGPSQLIDPTPSPFLAGPQAILGKDEVIHLAYYGGDGTIWYRSLDARNTLGPEVKLAKNVGTTSDAFGSVLPLVYLESKETVVIAYQLADLVLYERRINKDGEASDPVKITTRKIVREAADSQQPGADLVKIGNEVCALFIDDQTGEIYSATSRDGWAKSTLRVPNVKGNWIRATAERLPNGKFNVRFIYDTGSGGGAGMNRYSEFVTPSD